MKFLLTALLSLSFATNAFSYSTSEFMRGVRAYINIHEEVEVSDPVSNILAIKYEGFIWGALLSRPTTLANYTVKVLGLDKVLTAEEQLHHEKKLFGFSIPRNQYDAHIIAKLIINEVNSNPKLLSYDPALILNMTLYRAYAEAP